MKIEQIAIAFLESLKICKYIANNEHKYIDFAIKAIQEQELNTCKGCIDFDNENDAVMCGECKRLVRSHDCYRKS